jgi:hypothetical protein
VSKTWPGDYYGARAVAEPTCTCNDRERLVLGAVVNYGSPLRCAKCYNEIDPTAVLDESLVASLARWSSVHRALLDLFMEDEYSEWAKGELAAITSPVNRSALALLKYINQVQDCVYWVGGGANGDGRCPSCKSVMTVGRIGPSSALVCERCHLAMLTPSDAKVIGSRLTSA